LRTLFIDSSRKSLTVALAAEDKLLFVSNVDSNSKHSNFLVSEIELILNKANLKVNDIDNIVVLNGPGSFTGIRVGVTIAKTLAWTLDKKLYLVNNLEALKLCIPKCQNVISVIYDKLKGSYVGIYNKETYENYISLEDEKLLFNNENINIVSMDNNEYFNELYDRLSVNNNVNKFIIEEYDYLKIINFALSKGNINPHLAEPIYLKKIDAEK
jgi:tRNA threonylcarbamoyladenosine biosynthesis protein TsaB